MKKRLLFIPLIFLLPMLMMATTINGIAYTLEVSTKKATVIAKSPQYNGNIVIPSTIQYNGINYTVTAIGDHAFENCTELTSIDISNTVTSIGELAFYGCSSLSAIVIPQSVTKIGQGAFACGFSLSSIEVAGGNQVYDSREDCQAIIETSSNTLIAGCSSTVIPGSVTGIGASAFCRAGLTAIVIPEGVTRIGNRAFEQCSRLTSVTIPKSMKAIGFWTFYGCSNLSSVILPKGVECIEESTFEACTHLTLVFIPNSVTSIGFGAFRGCSNLSSIILPAHLEDIGEESFIGCSSLSSVTIKNPTPSIIDSSVFPYRDKAILYVPYGGKTTYGAAQVWRDFLHIVEDDSQDGDLNGDGNISVADVMMLVDRILLE